MNAIRRVVLATLLLSNLLVGSGCGGDAIGSPSPPTGDASVSEGSLPRICAPGQQVACACPGVALTGAQACNADGQGFGLCNGCPSMGATGGSPDGAPGHVATAGVDAAASGPGFDGTSGIPCTTSAGCKGARGPGINVCSNSLTYSVNAMIVNPLPTPVCMVPPASGGGGNCDPAPPSDPSAQLPHFCDGPDSPASPGICIASSSPHVGTCSPMCTFFLDGSAPTGCVGKDTCIETQFIALDSNNQLFGWGFCQGSCEQTSDCATLGAGYICQTDTGYCTASPVTRSKQLGQACTANDSTTGACNCLPGTTGQGYCTSSCIYGGAPCPMGWVCDTLQSATVHVGGNALTVPAENPGISGLCVAPCTAPDGGPAQCPATSTCKLGTPIGPDCLP
jgi:hypothetical protein